MGRPFVQNVVTYYTCGGKKETQGEDIETTEIGDSETIDIDCTNGNPIAVV